MASTIDPSSTRSVNSEKRHGTDATRSTLNSEHVRTQLQAAQHSAVPVPISSSADGELQAQQDEELSALERFCTDVTDEARQGMLDPLIGRDDELRRLIHILSRRTKNNPVLLGAPGVGKTAVVEGLAQRIVAGDVPVPLRGARLLELDARTGSIS